MATSTRKVLRRLLLEALGGGSFTTLTTTSAGAANGTTSVDTGLSAYDDDYFENWYLILPDGPGGSGSYETRQCTDFTSSTGTCTVRAASAQIATSVGYELSRYDPLKLHLAINRATELVYPHLYLPQRDETLLVDNLLLNPDMETGTFTNWTMAGAGAAQAAETNIVWHGTRSAKLTAGGGAALTFSQSIFASPGYVPMYRPADQTITFSAMIYATAASTVRLQLLDGTDTSSSSYHTGDDGWELLTVTHSPGSNISDIIVRVQVAAAGVGYVDGAFAYASGRKLRRYTRPTGLEHGPFRLSIQDDNLNPDSFYTVEDGWHFESDSSGDYLVLDDDFTSGHRIRLEGISSLSTVSTDAGTVEVGDPQANTLIYKAASWLMSSEHHDSGVQGRNLYGEDLAQYEAIYQDLIKRAPMRHPKRGARARVSWSYQ